MRFCYDVHIRSKEKHPHCQPHRCVISQPFEQQYYIIKLRFFPIVLFIYFSIPFNFYFNVNFHIHRKYSYMECAAARLHTSVSLSGCLKTLTKRRASSSSTACSTQFTKKEKKMIMKHLQKKYNYLIDICYKCMRAQRTTHIKS